ncbi:057R [Cherax quadricarinatus iridovirus]|uniref:Serine threonine kinase n=1 Tax=Shrimp hemocyte iridescent virus TaxID=2039780 RepID=A0A291B0T2_9VIRU|nr:057R [Cherax quadricarinatus iridovirus]YP_010084846.1 serine threonine kinase [Shrimp hemocyte iridescent virus]UPA43375.1 serine threonine kinase [Iridovirus CN01]ASZ85037.1 057R [Cherax quadricarinatus iridovirus]ATE87103.1 serine threonine kinase [Shrimp hemocyte iridescent virus]UPA43451.1 serine threonine kinase [Iridovirus CN01]UPA43645.1 serine threonine kinase [Iridovirus CN01]
MEFNRKRYKDLQIVKSGEILTVPARKISSSPVCIQWFNNPNVNPRTNRKIKTFGPTYRALTDECTRKRVRSDPREQRKPPRVTPRVISQPTSNKSWFDIRLRTGIEINNMLREMDVKQWNLCMSGTKSSKFQKNFTSIEKIGLGSFGQIYKARLSDGNSVVVKEAYLKLPEKRLAEKYTKKGEKWEDVDVKSYPRENKILELVNQLLLSRKCPNFVYVYNIAFCDGCVIKNYYQRRSTRGACYITFMEPADDNLRNTELRTYDQQLSVLYQLLISVHAIHKYYTIWHRDIKSTNIFIKKIKPGGYFKYVINGKNYFVKNTGIVAYLADFGVSEIMSPLYSSGRYYGTRNGEVAKMDRKIKGSNLYWKPIYIKGREIRYWYDETSSKNLDYDVIKGTRNKIATKNPIKSSRPIDLNDNHKFPPFEFGSDIQDVVNVFLGGKQQEQPGNHSRMPYLNSKIRSMLELKAKNTTIVNSIYGTVKYILADEMLNALYIEPKVVDKIIDTFEMY